MCAAIQPALHRTPLRLSQENCAPLAHPQCQLCYRCQWSWHSATLHDRDCLCPLLQLLLLLPLHPHLCLVNRSLPLGFLPSMCCLCLSHHLCPALLLYSSGLFRPLHFFYLSRLYQSSSASPQQAICLLLTSFCLRLSAFFC